MLKNGNLPAKLLLHYRFRKQKFKIEHKRTYNFGKSVWQDILYSITLCLQSRDFYSVVGRAYSVDIQVFAYNFHHTSKIHNEIKGFKITLII